MNYAIMRVEKLKSVSAATSRQKHNERTRGDALSDRTEHKTIGLRSSVAPQLKEDLTFAEFFKRQTQGQKIRKDAVKGFEVVLTFSHGAVKDADLKQWASDNFKFLCDTFGAHNLFSVELHMSETTPHIHAIATAIDDRGKLCAKSIINGPAHLRDLQTDYARRMEPYGLQRGISKKLTKAQHKSLREWYAETNYKSDRLQAYEKTFGDEKTWDIDTYIKFIGNTPSRASEAPEHDKTKTIQWDSER